MVKRTLPTLAAALVAAAVWGSGAREPVALAAEVMSFPGLRAPPRLSLVRRGASVAVICADRETTSLRVIEVPLAAALPATAPKPSFVDKVDTIPPLSGSFGLHAAAAVGGRLRILYLDRENEDRQLLKSVTEDPSGWVLELVEPLGSPIAVIAGPGGKPLDAWAPGPLLLRGADGVERTVRQGFAARGQAAVLDPDRDGGPSGFACWDDAARELLVVRTGPDGVRVSTAPAAGPVFAVAEAPDGTLAVATWDPDSRRILLLQSDAAAAFRQTTVTRCDGTHDLFLSWTPAGWLFVYDEVKPAPLGRWEWELGVLSPQPRAVGQTRYRRSVVSSGTEPIAGFRALVAAGSLYLLELRAGLRLLRTPLP